VFHFGLLTIVVTFRMSHQSGRLDTEKVRLTLSANTINTLPGRIQKFEGGRRAALCCANAEGSRSRANIARQCLPLRGTLSVKIVLKHNQERQVPMITVNQIARAKRAANTQAGKLLANASVNRADQLSFHEQVEELLLDSADHHCPSVKAIFAGKHVNLLSTKDSSLDCGKHYSPCAGLWAGGNGIFRRSKRRLHHPVQSFRREAEL
jgi:hypothetical protein